MDPEKIQKFRSDGFSDADIASVLGEKNPEAQRLLDSGMEPKLVIDNIIGTPQNVEKTKAQYIDEEIKKKYGEGGPSAAQLTAAVATELAISEGAKAGGAALGASIAAGAGQAGPQVATPEEVVTVPVGATIGYVAGAIKGGIAGSIAAQKIEGRDDISWGRVLVDTTLNLVPGGELKSGPKILQAASSQGANGHWGSCRPIRYRGGRIY
jgi:hypothetical protein